MSLFAYARKFLVGAVDCHLKFKGFKTSGDTVVQLHLDSDNFPMPKGIDKAKVDKLLRDRCEDISELRRCSHFEETQTVRGICRVLARTHLNRGGVGFVARGEPNRTITQRVLGVLDHADESQLKGFENEGALLHSWVEYATHADQRGLFADIDIASLKLLRDNPTTARAKGAHPNWVTVVCGISSGFKYLGKQFQFDAAQVWEKMDEAGRSAEDVIKLIESCRNEVYQFGPALAGSFFADLGSPNFAKPDVHVRDAMAAYRGQFQIGDLEALRAVLHEAATSGSTPRALDKIFYLACSGRYYLIGESAANPQEQKEAFLRHLRSFR